jgi:hypothetical protein
LVKTLIIASVPKSAGVRMRANMAEKKIPKKIVEYFDKALRNTAFFIEIYGTNYTRKIQEN